VSERNFSWYVMERMSDRIACYGVSEERSKGRLFEEERHEYRGDFERDRDRIIHCSAFRRLEGKTQVFAPGVNDFYRTRLTHSIEVAQIGRTIAKALGLNESLTEAICLAHDLGHSPFGHSGEKALNELMNDHGGFEHNRQSLRIVDLLEHPYPAFRGLNLMYETRLGLARHKSPYDKPGMDDFAEKNCSLEGQIADIADRIAYNCHDLEDGMRARLLKAEKLSEVPIFAEAEQRLKAERIEDTIVRQTRTAKAIIDMLVSDCIDSSRIAIEKADIEDFADVYEMADNLMVLSPANEGRLRELEGYLLKNFYMHESVLETAERVRQRLGKLFGALCRGPKLMPRYFQKFVDEAGVERAVCDYIAGMTDRYCTERMKELKLSFD
jgi:dGTPase